MLGSGGRDDISASSLDSRGLGGCLARGWEFGRGTLRLAPHQRSCYSLQQLLNTRLQIHRDKSDNFSFDFVVLEPFVESICG